jgi:hypothetical protein
MADAGQCAIKAIKRGCNILEGRSEVMSRTTLVARQETPEGARYEWGHLFVRVDGKPGTVRTFVPGENLEGGEQRGYMRLSSEHANVMADLLRAAHVNAGGSTCGGKTLYEMIWDEMMVVTDRLIGIQDAGGEPEPDDVGAARSLAWVIAIMQNPYLPNIDAVRQQVMERWEREDATPSRPSPPQARRTSQTTLAERRAARRG